jgi:precorrin-6Y C5,15-methyltransferase (decarboxylating)
MPETHSIEVIGIGADGAAGLRPELVERIVAADFLAGGERHLGYFPAVRGTRFVIRDDINGLLRELFERSPKERCVVLASGDPLFYGIGTTVLAAGFEARITPAVSSMQLAFARAGLPWDHAILRSVHGRDLRTILLPVLGKPLLGLFTHDGDGPAAVASFFIDHDLAGYEAFVGENLGTAEERVTRWPSLDELAAQRFAPLNYLVMRRATYPEPRPDFASNRALVPGVPDEAFARPADGPEMMTRQEVRSVVVGKLCRPVPVGATMWDLGAGLGTVAVEMAVLRPYLEVLAVERDPARAALLRQNRARFDAYNIQVLDGTAPEVLTGTAHRPVLVFLGGSGDRLPAILDLIHDRLTPGGRVVATFVVLENLACMLQRLSEWGWPYEITEVHVARSDPLAGHTGLKPQRGVFVVSADKPGDGA